MRTFIALVLGLAVGVGAALGVGAVLLSAAPAPVARVSPSPFASPSPSATAGACVAPTGSAATASACAQTTSPDPSAPPPPSSSAAPTASASGSLGASATPSGAPGSPRPTGSAAPSGSRSPSPSPSPSHATSPFPLVGQPAPPLVVPVLSGGTLDIASLRGRPVWVVFTGTYCPPCRDEYGLLNGYAARYQDDGLVVLAVHVKEDRSTVAAFVASVHAIFPVGVDGDGSRAQAWGAAVLPFHYFVDAQGVVRSAAIGAMDPVHAASALSTIMPGVKVTP